MAVIYRGIVTPKFRTKAMLNFIDGIGDTTAKNSYYMSFGRKTPWSSYETSPYFKPPYPATDNTAEAELWDNMMGLIKIAKASWIPVIPRIDWGNPALGAKGVTFQVNDVVVVNSMTGVNEYDAADSGYMVYRCVQIPDTGVCNISTIGSKNECGMAGGTWEPTSTPGQYINIPKGKQSAINTQDGYLWDYLYTIPPDEVINSTNEDYIVVPTPEQIEADPNKWGLKNVNPSNQINRLIYDVSCNSLMGFVRLTDADFPETNRSGNTGYRQISILVNPLEAKANNGDPDVKATKYSYYPSQLLDESGEVLYIENRPPIFRSSDQTELIRIILSF
ncbi:baseplate wedge subunit [Pseudomonas phage Astolliot]|nr:baseplate wedge subunit [Pseudomonas phage Astolliot]